VNLILDTHIHADHLSGLSERCMYVVYVLAHLIQANHYVKEKVGGRVAMSSQVHLTQRVVGDKHDLEFAKDG
jgi:glyoxylase-like metal-dependent hydrolase (beta-lactamase superfamily II)